MGPQEAVVFMRMFDVHCNSYSDRVMYCFLLNEPLSV